MKVVIFACTFAAAILLAAGAPVANDAFAGDRAAPGPNQPRIRAKRSQYGQPAQAYVSPCGAAPIAPLHLPTYPVAPAPVHQSYGGYGHSYGYAPHYRTDELDTEIMNFSDVEPMEHMSMARYGAAPAPLPYAHAPSGPAYGVFPNANVGGCNVPLLLSCSPSIVTGRMVKSYGGGYSAPAAAPAAASAVNVYRGVDEPQHEAHEEHALEHAAPEHAEPEKDTHAGLI